MKESGSFVAWFEGGIEHHGDNAKETREEILQAMKEHNSFQEAEECREKTKWTR
jgi:hypothetical protein